MFADYQLLAAMGQLLLYLKAPESADALPLESIPLAVFQVKIPPVLFQLPPTGPEPLNIRGDLVPPAIPYGTGLVPYPTKAASFSDRWPQLASWLDPTGGAPTSLSYAPEMSQGPSQPMSIKKPN